MGPPSQPGESSRETTLRQIREAAARLRAGPDRGPHAGTGSASGAGPVDDAQAVSLYSNSWMAQRRGWLEVAEAAETRVLLATTPTFRRSLLVACAHGLRHARPETSRRKRARAAPPPPTARESTPLLRAIREIVVRDYRGAEPPDAATLLGTGSLTAAEEELFRQLCGPRIWFAVRSVFSAPTRVWELADDLVELGDRPGARGPAVWIRVPTLALAFLLERPEEGAPVTGWLAPDGPDVAAPLLDLVRQIVEAQSGPVDIDLDQVLWAARGINPYPASGPTGKPHRRTRGGRPHP